jgi:hypothetical protein
MDHQDDPRGSGLFIYTHLKTDDPSALPSSKTGTSFQRPYDICFDDCENLLITSDSSSVVLRMNRLGKISNITEPMSSNLSVGLRGICIGFNGDIFVSCSDHCIRTIDSNTNQYSIFAGSVQGDQEGTGPTASFNWPRGLCFTKNLLFVADHSSHNIKTIDSSKSVVKYAGTSAAGDTDGPLLMSAFNRPSFIAVNPVSGHLFVTDTINRCIRMIDMDKKLVSTVVNGRKTSYDGLFGICFDHLGSMFIREGKTRFLKLDTQYREVFSYGMKTQSDSQDGPVEKFNILESYGCCTDSNGYLYVTDTSNNRIRKIETGSHQIQNSEFNTEDLLYGTLVALSPPNDKISSQYLKMMYNTCLTIDGTDYYVNRQLIASICPLLLDDQIVKILNTTKPSHRTLRQFFTFIYGEYVPKKLLLQDMIALDRLCVILKMDQLSKYLRGLMTWRLGKFKSTQSLLDTLVVMATEYATDEFLGVLEEMVDLIIPRLLPIESTILPHIDLLVEKVPHLVNVIVNKCLVSKSKEVSISLTPPVPMLRFTLESFIPSKVRAFVPMRNDTNQILNIAVPYADETAYLMGGEDSNVMLPCHVWVMAARWPYFMKMLKFGGKEVEEKKVSLPVKISGPALASLIIYMYSGKVFGFDCVEDRVTLLKCSIEFGLVDSNLDAYVPFNMLISHCVSDFSSSTIANDATKILCQHLQHGAEHHREILRGFVKKYALLKFKKQQP